MDRGNERFGEFFVRLINSLSPCWWYENVLNSQLLPDNPSCIMAQLLGQLQLCLDKLPQNSLDHSLLSTDIDFILNEYQHDPAKLFGTIKTCLELDGRFLMPQESPFPVITLSNKGIRFVILFSTIQVFIAKIEEAIGKFQQRSSLMSHGGSSNKIEDFRNLMDELLTDIKTGIDGMAVAFENLKTELNLWKLEQRKSLNGFEMSECLPLNKIEDLAKLIAKYILKISKQLKESLDFMKEYNFHELFGDLYQRNLILKEEVKGLLMVLATKTFVVEKHPNQIVASKTTCVTMKLRFLIGEILNCGFEACVKVKVLLINEEEAVKLHANFDYIPTSVIELNNNIETMKFDKKSNIFGVEFTKTSLKECKKQPKKSEDPGSVTDVKRCFYFQTDFPVEEYIFTLKTVSYCVVVTSNHSQHPSAWATIFWDNATADVVSEEVDVIPRNLYSRIPFTIQPKMFQEEFLDHLDKSMKLNTGKGLTSRNKDMLWKKILLIKPREADESQIQTVSWERFAKTPILTKTGYDPIRPNSTPAIRRSTFSDLFYYIMKLCKKSDKNYLNSHIQKYWENGYIEGFITDENMINVFYEHRDKRPFMLKFSETVLGAVTLNWFDYHTWYQDSVEDRTKCQKYSTKYIKKYDPYTMEDLQELSLAKRIQNKSHLKYLCFGDLTKEKSEAFPIVRSQPPSIIHKLLDGYIGIATEEVENLIRHHSNRLSIFVMKRRWFHHNTIPVAGRSLQTDSDSQRSVETSDDSESSNCSTNDQHYQQSNSSSSSQ